MIDQASQKKTIFITCFFGLVARDILDTPVLEMLARKFRVVILTSQLKEGLVREIAKRAGSDIEVEGIAQKKTNRLEGHTLALLRDLLSTGTRRVQRLVKYKSGGSMLAYILGGILAIVGKSGVVVRMARKLAAWAIGSDHLDHYFENYHPDLVFATDVMVLGDVRFLMAARRNKVRTLGMVRSWDNLTLYGILPAIPDVLVVQNEPIREELYNYQYISRSYPVKVVGIPHYDSYVKEPRTPRKDFLLSLGLNPAKKTVFFTPTAAKHWKDPGINVAILEALSSMNVNVLARLPVMGDVDLKGFDPVKNIILDKPVRTKESADAQLDATANRHLADSIYNSDVVLTGPSTIIIDAAVFNKPVVYVNFDQNKVPFWQSAKRFMNYNHIRTILNTGGARVANDLESMTKAVKDYLADPSLDEQKRQQLILQKRYKLDGRSADRLAEVITRSVL